MSAWKSTGDPNELLLMLGPTPKAQLSMMEDGTWTVFIFDSHSVAWYADLAGARGSGDQSKAQQAVEKIVANINNDSTIAGLVVGRKRIGT